MRASMEVAAAVGSRAPAEEREARFARFVASHRERARCLAFRLVGGDEAAADDVVQDALVRAWRALPRFRGEARLETWFYRIVVRQAQNHRRWRAVRERFGGELGGELPDPSAKEMGDPAMRRRIASAIGRLSRRQREAFVLIHLEGFTVRECAEVLGKPAGTVKSHLHRALTALRRELSDLQDSSSMGGLVT